MSLTYPLSLPSNNDRTQMNFRKKSVVGVSQSPFTGEQQGYVHQGQWWEVDVQLPPMTRADAEDWIGFLLALNGMEGTFLMGDPVNTSPRGTWAGTPLIVGSHAAGLTSLSMDGFSNGATVKAGDWFQTPSTTYHLHKVLTSQTAGAPGTLTIEIFPRLREALSDNAALITSSPVGIWRLANNEQSWSIRAAAIYGLSFSAMEAF